jgi:hypothetical protein
MAELDTGTTTEQGTYETSTTLPILSIVAPNAYSLMAV